MSKIDFYFDVISPYSYVGFEALQQIESQWKDVQIRYIPFFLGAVMKSSGNHPPENLLSKAEMMMNDLERAAKYWGITINRPHPFQEWIKKYRTTGALRLLLALQDIDLELMLRAARKMWIRLWVECKKIFEEEDFMEILKEVGVINGADVIEMSKEKKYTERLMENTKMGVELKAYGAPWIHVTHADGSEHSFFGSDRFHFIADLLRQPQPLPERLFEERFQSRL